ncbi:unnamed protein product [Sphenostylis stenocarpa]|uniref:Uncharacterized protein n=1 Tax=Sphenostylis stenocarpa TaxID=92480 RepID=A0AA86VJI1_9FABA|nr:unnamed protein product [Sphenostylis stenocarpa]
MRHYSFMKSPSQPTYDEFHFDDYGFDLQHDFCQFLEEAKQHGKEAKLKSSSVCPEDSRNAGSEKEKKGKKKSWKSSLTSWWKSDKKSKHSEKTTNDSKSKGGSGKRHGHSSGPMYRSSKSSDGKHWRPSSGPLVNLFKPTKREENEIPYISLQHQNNSPPADQNYGPLYVVT